MKAVIRQEDQEKGFFYVVDDCHESKLTDGYPGEAYDGRRVYSQLDQCKNLTHNTPLLAQYHRYYSDNRV